MRFLVGVVLLLGVAGAGMGATPAAGNGSVYITAIHVAAIHVNNGGCHNTTMSVHFVDSGYSVDDVKVQIWRGAHYLETDDLYSVSGGVAHGGYYYCPNLDGLGVFRAGPSEIDYHDAQYNSYTTNDSTRTHFIVKQAARTALRVKRSGRRVTLRSRVKYYSVGGSGWYFATGAKQRLQRRQRAEGRWRTVAHSTTHNSDQDTFRLTTAHRYYYRVLTKGTKRSWSSASKVIRR